jgi:hypothetical protein
MVKWTAWLAVLTTTSQQRLPQQRRRFDDNDNDGTMVGSQWLWQWLS